MKSLIWNRNPKIEISIYDWYSTLLEMIVDESGYNDGDKIDIYSSFEIRNIIEHAPISKYKYLYYHVSNDKSNHLQVKINGILTLEITIPDLYES